jgi:hypothetical protein
MNLSRILYIGYYLKTTDQAKLKRFSRHINGKQGKAIWPVLIYNALKYNISLLEYFLFNFYNQDAQAKQTYAGTGYMYEYQLLMNPKAYRQPLQNKIHFLKEFAPFIKHQFATIDDVKEGGDRVRELLENPSGKIVLKSHDGQCGWGVEVIEARELDQKSLLARMEKSGNDLAEAYITQHPDLMRLSPSGLNTIRIITQLNQQDEVDIIGCRLRISVNSHVDNLASGNMVAVIDEATGKVTSPAVFSDITKADQEYHPVTGTPIKGFQIPYWQETLDLAKKAALHYKKCRSIGWDIAITEQGPDLLEGNHDWCKLVWQLPLKQGLKPILEKYRKALKNKA